MRQRSGFTLVELAIVLVIIGLLIGGILAAQSLISTAKINAQVRQLQQFDIAFSNFKNTYNRLPGEKIAADSCGSFFGGICGHPSWVGNGRIDSGWSGAASPGAYDRLNYYEGTFGFIELSQYDLISDKYEMIANTAPNLARPAVGKGGVIPESKISDSNTSGILPVSNSNGDLFWFLSVRPNGNLVENIMSNFYFGNSGPLVKPIDAVAIDAKLDDGNASTGDVVAVSIDTKGADGDYYPFPLDSSIGGCVTGSGYNSSINSPQCYVIVRAKNY